MKTHSGSCLCGSVAFTLEGDIDAFYLCHCQYCQKDTGTAHAANLISKSARLYWKSGENDVTTFILPGTRHGKSFCKHCGSALPSVQLSGSLVVIPAGCLDTRLSVVPNAHIFTESRASWDSELEKLLKYDRWPA